MLASTVLPSTKKKLGIRAIAGIVVAVSFLGILVVSNLDIAGKACSEEGSLLPAAVCFETMISIESLLGIRSTRLVNALTELSICYSRESLMPEAIRAQRRAIQLEKEIHGANYPRVLILQANLASYLAKAKDYASAENLLNEALAEIKKQDNSTPYVLGFILNAQAEIYLAQKKYSEAERTLDDLVVVDRLIVASGYYPFYGQERLAEAYARSGRLDEAEQAAREAMAEPGAGAKDHAAAVPAHEALGKVLLLQGRTDDAKKEFDKALVLLLGKYGNSDRTSYWRARYAHMIETKDPFKE